MSWTKAMDKWGPQKLYDHLYNILYVQESLSWNMSLTLSKLDIEVSPFTYALRAWTVFRCFSRYVPLRINIKSK